MIKDSFQDIYRKHISPIKGTNVSWINRTKERWKCIIEAKLATRPLKVHAKLDNWPISGNIVFYSVIPISTCTREKLTFVFPDDFTGLVIGYKFQLLSQGCVFCLRPWTRGARRTIVINSVSRVPLIFIWSTARERRWRQVCVLAMPSPSFWKTKDPASERITQYRRGLFHGDGTSVFRPSRVFAYLFPIPQLLCSFLERFLFSFFFFFATTLSIANSKNKSWIIAKIIASMWSLFNLFSANTCNTRILNIEKRKKIFSFLKDSVKNFFTMICNNIFWY